MKIIELQVTFPDNTTAHSIAARAIQGHLAACANILPIDSIYRWNGVIRNDPEYLVIFKTIYIKLEALIRDIKSDHPYELPAILYWETEATEEYASWVTEQLLSS